VSVKKLQKKARKNAGAAAADRKVIAVWRPPVQQLDDDAVDRGVIAVWQPAGPGGYA
jgi:hypothetical protein